MTDSTGRDVGDKAVYEQGALVSALQVIRADRGSFVPEHPWGLWYEQQGKAGTSDLFGQYKVNEVKIGLERSPANAFATASSIGFQAEQQLSGARGPFGISLGTQQKASALEAFVGVKEGAAGVKIDATIASVGASLGLSLFGYGVKGGLEVGVGVGTAIGPREFELGAKLGVGGTLSFQLLTPK